MADKYTAQDLIDELKLYNPNSPVTILVKHDNVTEWKQLEPCDIVAIPSKPYFVIRIGEKVAHKR